MVDVEGEVQYERAIDVLLGDALVADLADSQAALVGVADARVVQVVVGVVGRDGLDERTRASRRRFARWPAGPGASSPPRKRML